MLCLIGLGTIGKMLVPMARGFGMSVTAFRRDISKDGDIDGVEKIYPTEDRYVALRQADYIILVLPLNEETFHIIDEKAFSSMKSNAFLINMSRGDHIDRVALEKALADKSIAGFDTDVFGKSQPTLMILCSETNVFSLHLIQVVSHMQQFPEERERFTRIFRGL